MSRALVACGWFGIQTWIGGSCLHQMISSLTGGGGGGATPAVIAMLGITAPEFACFLAFWVVQVLAGGGG